MTLSDREYQLMRDASFACIREIGVGGEQHSIRHGPKTGRMVVIEMNPRVSRSSAWPKQRDFQLQNLPPSGRLFSGRTPKIA